jgi:hypothetical protein
MQKSVLGATIRFAYDHSSSTKYSGSYTLVDYATEGLVPVVVSRTSSAGRDEATQVQAPTQPRVNLKIQNVSKGIGAAPLSL